MSLSFSKAASGEEICFWNNKPLHSTFNPIKEAQRFVHTLSLISPSYIIFLGPCLPFCVSLLKEKYPQTKIIALQYFSGLQSYTDSWDYEIIHSHTDTTSDALYNIIGEELSSRVEIISWNTSERLFYDSYISACNAIKLFLSKSKDVLGTRIFFSKRWFKNVLSFFSNVSNICIPSCGSFPVVITASGPSLLSCIPFIRTYRKSFLLIALSSSLSVLSHYHIESDLCLTTDGGYWAKKHLSLLHTNSKTILAMSAESSVPKKLFSTRYILPLNYDNDFSSQIYKSLSIPNVPAVRNGTVSGTALFLARLLTTGPIIFSGLDLCTAKGYQHTQPNMLEKYSETSDTRLRNLQTRLTGQELNSGALSLYEQWFKLLPDSNTHNVYRVKPASGSFNNTLSFKDIYLEQLPSLIDISKQVEIEFNYFHINKSTKMFITILNKYISKLNSLSYRDAQKFTQDIELLKLAESVSLQKFLLFSKYKTEESWNELIYDLNKNLNQAIKGMRNEE